VILSLISDDDDEPMHVSQMRFGSEDDAVRGRELLEAFRDKFNVVPHGRGTLASAVRSVHEEVTDDASTDAPAFQSYVSDLGTFVSYLEEHDQVHRPATDEAGGEWQQPITKQLVDAHAHRLHFRKYKKQGLTEAMRMSGPFRVETSEGPVTCEDGWLAIDSRGHPYPIADEEFVQIYEPVV
jgi:hypothetical protein